MGALDCAETEQTGPNERGMATRERERAGDGPSVHQAHTVLETWRRKDGKAAAVGTDPSKESDKSTYIVFTLLTLKDI